MRHRMRMGTRRHTHTREEKVLTLGFDQTSNHTIKSAGDPIRFGLPIATHQAIQTRIWGKLTYTYMHHVRMILVPCVYAYVHACICIIHARTAGCICTYGIHQRRMMWDFHQHVALLIRLQHKRAVKRAVRAASEPSSESPGPQASCQASRPGHKPAVKRAVRVASEPEARPRLI
jgi:hypothetical protein